MPKNSYRSHRGRSAVARRVIMSGAAGSSNGIMSPLGYWGGMKKGGLAPSVPAMPPGARALAGGKPPLVNHPQHLMHKTHGKYGSWEALCAGADGEFANASATPPYQFKLPFPVTGEEANNVCRIGDNGWKKVCESISPPLTCGSSPPDCSFIIQRREGEFVNPQFIAMFQRGSINWGITQPQSWSIVSLAFQLAFSFAGPLIVIPKLWSISIITFASFSSSPTSVELVAKWPISKNSPLYNFSDSIPSNIQYWAEAQKDYEAFINTGSSGQAKGVPTMYHLPAKGAMAGVATNPGRH